MNKILRPWYTTFTFLKKILTIADNLVDSKETLIKI